MRRKDIAFIERQLDRLEFVAPPMPSAQDIFRYIVRIDWLWTRQELAYIEHFHKVYGLDERRLDGIALDAWSYWHLEALGRYNMRPYELTEYLRARPTTRPLVWRFSMLDGPAMSKARRQRWKVCMTGGNTVSYDTGDMQRRGWRLVSSYGFIGFLFSTPPPCAVFAFVDAKNDVTLLFESVTALEDLAYYLEHREQLHKQYKVQRIDAPIDLTVYEPDAGYSYTWPGGVLIPGSYMDQRLAHREQVRQDT